MLSEQIKTKTSELAQGSTAFGVPNIFRSKRWFNRLFWLCFVIASNTVSFFYVYQTIDDFFDFDVVTVIQTKFDQPARFPTVTFCSLNKEFDSKKLTDYSFVDTEKGVSRFGYSSILNLTYFINQYFERFQSSQYGTCFRFNSGKNMINRTVPFLDSTIGGRDDCLKLVFKIEINLEFWIHESDDRPRIELFENHDNPIFVSGGTESHLSIEKTVDTKLGEPYNHCLENVSLFDKNKTIINYIQSINESYKQIKCFELCFDLNYLQNDSCHCRNVSLGNVWINCWVNIRNNKTLSDCVRGAKEQFYQRTLNEVCSEYCPLECESITYSVMHKLYSLS